MRRLAAILILGLLVMPSAFAQKVAKLPKADELKAVNDSILAEGYQLYLLEKVAWNMEDCFYEYASQEAVDACDGWVPICEDGVNVKGVFYDMDTKSAVWDAVLNIEDGNIGVSDSVRELTEDELVQIEAHQKMIGAVHSLEFTPTYPEGCTFNVDVLGLGDGLYRVFWILGTTQNNIIPFGNDFSYDCDSEGNIVAWRRYHNSYIPLPIEVDGEKAAGLWHSHTKMSPYITPTDIAIFLLYATEPAGLTKLVVYSTAFKRYFTFDAEAFEITVSKKP